MTNLADTTTQTTIAIIDVGTGNLRSVHKAMERAVEEKGLSARVIVTNRPEDVYCAERLVLPGVGAFAACMDGLNKLEGLRPALEKAVLEDKKPFLGICVGMQILADYGEEFGRQEGLGWIKGAVRKLDGERRGVRVPHMGWNKVQFIKNNILFDNKNENIGASLYFLHSFHFDTENNYDIKGVCDYGGPVVAAIGHDNIAGVQFHPEKSQEAGIDILKLFLEWQP